ncbi:MAG: hypothetical protein HIU92_00810 [Proteobacteria bacterium]|nr:hypothetical protein [Pseudomonadota bacterium]
MTIEMKLLLWSVVIGLLQCLATGMAVSSHRGIGFSSSARDDQEPIGGIGGRVIRAFANFKETYVFFVVLVLAGQVLDRHSALTVIGANLYFWGRLAYWPLYVAGVPMVRSLVWVVAILGLVLMLIGVA